MKKHFFLILFFVFQAFGINAQQDPQVTQNMYTQLMINPAYAGSEGMICAYAMERLQWTGFEGAPENTFFNVDMPVKKFGLGLSLENRLEGFNSDFKVNLSIAYRFSIRNAGNLGVGIKWGVASSTLDATWKTPGDDYTIDPAIPPEDANALSFMDFGFGLYYKTSDLYLGISSTQLYKTEFENEKIINETSGETNVVKTTLKRHYYITAGYSMPFTNPLLVFKPNVFVMSDGTNTQLALNGIIEYNKKLWGGVSIRTDNAISGIIGGELFKWVKVSYSYDFVVSDLMQYNNGTHEIMMGFCLDVKKDKTPEKYKSIRFL